MPFPPQRQEPPEKAPRWSSAGVVTYKATAKRNDEAYVTGASSAYVRDGAAWKLAFHQQTPL